MKGGMNSIMRQAQKMQSQIAKVQEEIKERRVEASTGGGVVTAVVNGDGELLELTIDPEVLDPDDVELVEEMVVGAVSQAQKSANDMMEKEIEEITGGVSIPGLM